MMTCLLETVARLENRERLACTKQKLMASI